MTNREFFNAIINGENNEEIMAHAMKEIENLDKRNAARADKPSKTQEANEPIKAKIMELLTSAAEQTASMIAEKLEISTQKASALCRQLVDEGKVVSEEIKVPKKGKQKAYTLNAVEDNK